MNPSVEIENIIRSIRATLEEYTEHASQKQIRGNRQWTYDIKARLRDLGRGYGFEISTCGFHNDCEPEWLYDLVWYKEDGEGESRRLVDVPLVVESEWSLHISDIQYDFEKLLLANAPLRLMICQARNSLIANRFDYFRHAVYKYQRARPGDTFLIAILSNEDEEFYFETVTK